jgi:RHS repeat-associated protein
MLFAVCATAGEVVTYYHNDIVGSPVAATDAYGQVAWRSSYEPYGERIQSSADQQASAYNVRWYTGHVQDLETDLVYMQARYYDPLLGRFMAVDAAGFDSDNLQSFNRYAYANNNPYKFDDPDGRIVNFVIKAAVDFGLEVAIQYVTTGTVDIGSALTETAIGLINPAKTLERARDVARIVRSGGKAASGGRAKLTGSYTNTHASGKTYDGKGDKSRSQRSGRRVEKENNDPHVATEWKAAENNREALKDEARRLEKHGGPDPDKNYNKLNSPGKKYREEDGN